MAKDGLRIEFDDPDMKIWMQRYVFYRLGMDLRVNNRTLSMKSLIMEGLTIRLKKLGYGKITPEQAAEKATEEYKG